ncbi:MAG: ATP-binding cassette domain-containing protein [Aeromicrobium sp.]|uniref:ATP-binding cassette domain-containing protein n=1 Tax=Aeromicrobium sp. TaxID=1871063 RepID=UPI0039E4CC4B
MGAPHMVEAVDLRKSFGDVEALRGLSLHADAGEILGVLGPNGAGKTTTINVLATLVRADAGTARIDGFDVDRDAPAVRSRIGLAGQFAALDANLTARENLILFGRLLKLGRAGAARRADALLAEFDLADAARRRSGTFSGGMRRRLDLAASMVGRPRVLFLDEPTTGLDPRSRNALWDTVRRLRADGMTIVLTTQYLAEAEELADRVVVIDQGRVVAEGTAAELKERVGGAVCHLRADGETLAEIERVLARRWPVARTGDELAVPADGAETLVEVVRALDAHGLAVSDIGLRRPTLDDVFLDLTAAPAARVGEPVG